MKKFATIFAATATLMGGQAVSAATYAPAPSGPHVFQGNVDVSKDGGTYSCTLTVNANVTSSSTATATASISGGFPCGLISITGTGSITHDGTDWGISGLTIDPPISSGLCTGRIKFGWGGNSGTRTIALSKPYSNSSATSGKPCTLVGTLTNTSPTPNTLTLTP